MLGLRDDRIARYSESSGPVRKLNWINCLRLHICKTTWLLELDLTLHIVPVTMLVKNNSDDEEDSSILR